MYGYVKLWPIFTVYRYLTFSHNVGLTEAHIPDWVILTYYRYPATVYHTAPMQRSLPFDWPVCAFRQIAHT